jgi:hypothetical protein
MAEIEDMEFSEGESTLNPAAVNDRLDRPAHALFTSGTAGPVKCKLLLPNVFTDCKHLSRLLNSHLTREENQTLILTHVHRRPPDGQKPLRHSCPYGSNRP